MQLKNRRFFFILCFALLLLLEFYFIDFVVDDAFISYRYAKNLVRGNGMVFNLGEKVEGYTNFLWVILISIFIKVGATPVIVSKVFGIVSSFLLLYGTYLIGKKLLDSKYPYDLIALFLLSVSPCIAVWAVGGLETVFFAALVVWAIYFFFSTKYLLLSPYLFILASMTRPEGVLFFLIILVYMLIVRRYRDSLGFLTRFLIFGGIYFVWRLYYFGDLLPNTFYAKVGRFGGHHWLSGFGYFYDFVKYYGGGFLFVILPVFPILLKRTSDKYYFIIGTVVVYSLYILCVGSDWMPQYRFFVPVLPFFYLLIQKGIETLGGQIKKRYMVYTVILLFLMVQSLQSLAMIILSHRPKTTFFSDSRINIKSHKEATSQFIEVGKLLKEIASPNDSMITYAVGAIGYYSDLYIIDTHGLVSPHLIPLSDDEMPEYILETHPTFVENISGELRLWGYEEEFASRYVSILNEGILRKIYVRRENLAHVRERLQNVSR